jgi:hypothetical protein
VFPVVGALIFLWTAASLKQNGEGVDPKSGKTLASNAFSGRIFEALNRL